MCIIRILVTIGIVVSFSTQATAQTTAPTRAGVDEVVKNDPADNQVAVAFMAGIDPLQSQNTTTQDVLAANTIPASSEPDVDTAAIARAAQPANTSNVANVANIATVTTTANTTQVTASNTGTNVTVNGTSLSSKIRARIKAKTNGKSTIRGRIKGDGNIVTVVVNTPEYDIVNLVGSMDVHLEKGVEGNISITTDANLQEIVEVKVVNNKLILKIVDGVHNYSTTSGIHITVPFEEISQVHLDGSGDIDSKDIIVCRDFKTSVDGSGDIVLEVKATNVKARIDGSGDLKLQVDAAEVRAGVGGSGDIKLSGLTDYFKVNVTGSGGVWGFNLESQITDVSITGSGDAKVVAREKLKARVVGSGDIIYKGNPSNNNSSTVGSGDIRQSKK